MYKMIALLVCVLMLGGCSAEKEMAPLYQLRRSMEQDSGCAFDVHIISQSDDHIHRFTLYCVETEDILRFEVAEPESIRGITGSVSNKGGALEFDDTLLSFPLLANGEISPVIAPWLLLECLKNGLVRYVGAVEEGYSVTFHHSFRGEQLQVEAVLAENGIPKSCELFWDGKRILYLELSDFRFL